MQEELHPKRRELLVLLARCQRGGGGEPPTQRELARAMGYSSSRTVPYHLDELERAGYIERGEAPSRKRRPVALTAKGWQAVGGGAPLMGRVAAGPGIEAIADEGETASLAADLLVPRAGRRRYTVTAHGDSMTGARIEEGDTLLVEENEDPPNGSLVLALLHGRDVTVKRFYRDGEKVRLRWQNGEPRELILPAGEVRVQGEVIRVIIEPGR